MHSAITLILILLSFPTLAGNTKRLNELKTIKRIAFGSCNNQNDHQPLWKDMIIPSTMLPVI